MQKLLTTIELAYLELTKTIPNSATQKNQLSQIRNKMYLNPIEYTLPVMIAESGYSVAYFSTLYKKYFEISPVNDRNIALIKIMKHYLETTQYSLEKIAEICDIQSITYLINIFKKHVNLTPHQYRLQFEKKND